MSNSGGEIRRSQVDVRFNDLTSGVRLMKRSPTDHEETYEEGEFIIRQGDETREMYVIQEGEVVVLKETAGGETVEFNRLGRGEFFGEMSLLESLPRSMTVRAARRTRLLVIKPGALLLRIRRNPTFAFEMLQAMSRRIRMADERLLEMINFGELTEEAARKLSDTITLDALSSATEYRP